ncbi:Hydrogenase maturation protein, carbamoyltransferase HypF [Tistlia consotensis]|uniref:Carbamoyltransferase HypF n=1 Tax=Tistlia consotensis USBA 355 TaxID=560819 RepID=A0A1Y6BVG1_9PROT|nr:carbamoyltransferase HypF [Tistlia consotensis]SMF30633.1 Hydrogenase maturation protein, carbamoyltransferase HypF [Tistlia consotensis USBA 355]SNS19879.1 Hydrogenase maturation protein, carbamoyltransferase HypF [Tistlia consotensis]
MRGESITVRGQVQGVGFRPTVWRIATELGLSGEVRNSGEGVEIRLWGTALERFTERLRAEAPALARIERIETAPLDGPAPEGFRIALSGGGAMHASVTPDAATCPDCLAEVRDPFVRRYRYPFANCTNCGPRFSIVEAAPYDRERTTMRAFALCPDCRAEYEDPADRRFHAQPIACHACGPRAWIEHLGGGAVSHEAFSLLDAVDAAGGMLTKGHIVAIKGIGGFHLACDAADAAAVERLRARKGRRAKPFALMARDLETIRRYCALSEAEAAALQSPAAPIVLLQAEGEALPDAVAPGLGQLGFMLPYTPLHHLLLRRMARPVVMTSGNVSGRPQCTRNEAARAELAGVADFALMHDREIANRIDDSVLRVDLGRPRLLRRARGYAPAPIALPAGFDGGLRVLALGGELKNAFCLVKDGQAILSQHMGDLEDAATAEEAARNLALYQGLYEHEPELVAVDRHPDYLSSKRGREMALGAGLPLVEVQHHHAHIAACLAENGLPLDSGPVLGIALDGLGFGEDGTIWGGEFLACDYRSSRRLGCLKPVALPGGSAAVRAPWRNAYAQLMAELGWAELAMNFGHLALFERLEALPRATLDAMIAKGLNSPLSSSCGRLFDAAAALCGLAWDEQAYEGEAAMRLEAAVDPAALGEPDELAYPFSIPLLGGRGLPYLEPLAAWRALLGDLHLETPVGVIAARFHRGLAKGIVAMAERLSGAERSYPTVALSGGCFQNRTLLALVHEGLEARGFSVLSHERVPANDGGLALGQAVVALATRQAQSRQAQSRQAQSRQTQPGREPCA